MEKYEVLHQIKTNSLKQNELVALSEILKRTPLSVAERLWLEDIVDNRLGTIVAQVSWLDGEAGSVPIQPKPPVDLETAQAAPALTLVPNSEAKPETVGNVVELPKKVRP